MKLYKKTILIAAGLFIFDAFLLNQGIVAFLIIPLIFFVFLPRALWALRTSRSLSLQRFIRAGIYLLAAAAIFVTNAQQNRMADRRAVVLGKACLAYHAKYNQYPERLNQLVPEFIPSVPLAKYTLASGNSFIPADPAAENPCCITRRSHPLGGGSTTWKPADGGIWTEGIEFRWGHDLKNEHRQRASPHLNLTMSHSSLIICVMQSITNTL